MNLKCMIVDDDPMSRKLLERHCSKYPELELTGVCENVEEALNILETKEIDLIFLDIEMPGSLGFDLLDQATVNPYVIITTSKEHYAFDAFQYEVADYLRKPIKIPRFQKAIAKVKELMRASQPSQKRIPDQNPKNVFVKSDGKLIKIALDQILFIENAGDYVCFHTEEKKYIVNSTMKKLEEKLPSARFMKVHRSYIINLEKIVDIEENSILINGSIVPVSRANKAALMERLNLI